MMKRWLVVLAVFGLIAAACTAGDGESEVPEGLGETGSGRRGAGAGHDRDVDTVQRRP
mgnify:CR=1 FL=1